MFYSGYRAPLQLWPLAQALATAAKLRESACNDLCSCSRRANAWLFLGSSTCMARFLGFTDLGLGFRDEFGITWRFRFQGFEFNTV